LIRLGKTKNQLLSLKQRIISLLTKLRQIIPLALMDLCKL